MPRVENGRRLAGYYFRARARANERQLSMLSDEQFEELGVVNQIRQQVRAWREAGYPGGAPVTRQLLAHWARPDRERRLFFCQLEAAETVIWLVEVRGGRKPKPEAVVREAERALQALAGEWQATFQRWQQDGYPTPPVLIAVCDNTDIAEYLYEKIAVEAGNSLLLPRIDRFRPRGSTEEVLFRTTPPVRAARKSHISHVVLDTATWEASTAFHTTPTPATSSSTASAARG